MLGRGARRGLGFTRSSLQALFALGLSGTLIAALAAASSGCSDDVVRPPMTTSDAGADSGDSADSADSGGPTTVTLYPDAPPLPGESECKVVMVTGIPVESASHVPFCTDVEYATNPPSGGNHWGQWAAFKKYSSPVPREMYVHDLEHGAVVIGYRCSTGCPELAAALGEIYDGLSLDPLCVQSGGIARAVLTPDPELETPIGASAWGATYVATCLDPASLSQFLANVYGSGPEHTCAPGRDPEDPEAGLPDCDAGTEDGGGGAGGAGGAGGGDAG
jgi:Protein of unknown function (DUF3105)